MYIYACWLYVGIIKRKQEFLITVKSPTKRYLHNGLLKNKDHDSHKNVKPEQENDMQTYTSQWSFLQSFINIWWIVLKNLCRQKVWHAYGLYLPADILADCSKPLKKIRTLNFFPKSVELCPWFNAISKKIKVRNF